MPVASLPCLPSALLLHGQNHCKSGKAWSETSREVDVGTGVDVWGSGTSTYRISLVPRPLENTAWYTLFAHVHNIL